MRCISHSSPSLPLKVLQKIHDTRRSYASFISIMTLQLSNSNKYAIPHHRQEHPSQPFYPYDEVAAAAQDFAQDTNKLKIKPPLRHIQTLIASLLLAAGIALALIFYLNGSLSGGNFIGILLSTYTLYLLVACCCNTLTQNLSDIDEDQRFEPYYELVRKTNGRFILTAVCYHYETRNHTRRVKDSEGRSSIEQYSTTEKVITHQAAQHLTPIATRDVSGPIEKARQKASLLFVHFKITHKFQTPQSQRNFNIFFSNFKMRHTRDTNQDFGFEYRVGGVKERMTFCVEKFGCQFRRWLFLCGGIGCIYPYSLWVEVKSSRYIVDMVKSVTIR